MLDGHVPVREVLVVRIPFLDLVITAFERGFEGSVGSPDVPCIGLHDAGLLHGKVCAQTLPTTAVGSRACTCGHVLLHRGVV